MNVLLTLLEIVIPVFLLIGAGYAAVRFKALPDQMVDALVKFQITAAVPSLLFMAMYRMDLGVALHLEAQISFYSAATASFFLAMYISRWVWKRRPGESVVVGFCAMFPNAVMLGIPITERAFGGVALAAVFGIIAFHSLYNYFLGFVMMEAVRRDSETVLAGLRKAFVTTVTNPLMVGILLGLAVNLVSLPVPKMAEDALDMLARAAIPVSLFALGGVLTRYRLRDEIGESLMVSCFSLIVHPLLAWILTDKIFGLPLPYVQATVVMAAMPTGINSYIFAAIYGRAVGTAANSVLIGTVLSVLTITGWLAFLNAGSA